MAQPGHAAQPGIDEPAPPPSAGGTRQRDRREPEQPPPPTSRTPAAAAGDRHARHRGWNQLAHARHGWGSRTTRTPGPSLDGCAAADGPGRRRPAGVAPHAGVAMASRPPARLVLTTAPAPLPESDGKNRRSQRTGRPASGTEADRPTPRPSAARRSKILQAKPQVDAPSPETSAEEPVTPAARKRRTRRGPPESVSGRHRTERPRPGTGTDVPASAPVRRVRDCWASREKSDAPTHRRREDRRLPAGPALPVSPE